MITCDFPSQIMCFPNDDDYIFSWIIKPVRIIITVITWIMCNVTMQLHLTPLIMVSNIYMQSNLLCVVSTWNIINNVQQNYFSSEQLPAIPLILID